MNGVVGPIFLDPHSHRLLVNVYKLEDENAPNISENSRLVWLDNRKTLFNLTAIVHNHDFDNPRCVDFDQKRIFVTQNGSQGSGLYLRVLTFQGKAITPPGEGQEGHLNKILIGKRPDLTYHFFYPVDEDIDFAIPWIDVYRSLKPVQHQELPKGSHAGLLCYAEAQDRLYIHLGHEGMFRPYSGKTLLPVGPPVRLPGSRRPKFDGYRRSHLMYNTLFADGKDGKIAYYANRNDDILYKFRLADGKVQAARRLPFATTTLALDEARKRIYLVDGLGSNVVTARLF